MIVLDTNVVSETLRGRPAREVMRWLERLLPLLYPPENDPTWVGWRRNGCNIPFKVWDVTRGYGQAARDADCCNLGINGADGATRRAPVGAEDSISLWGGVRLHGVGPPGDADVVAGDLQNFDACAVASKQ